MKKLITLAMLLGLVVSGCATTGSFQGSPSKTYQETVSGWTSYRDVETWMRDVFIYDSGYLITPGIYRTPRAPRITFKLQSGLCWDAARFTKETLDLINPAYEAQIVFIDRGIRDIVNVHFVCSLKKEDGKLYIMDYGTMRSHLRGTHGPYNSLKDYEEFVGYPCSYGWPSYFKTGLEK